MGKEKFWRASFDKPESVTVSVPGLDARFLFAAISSVDAVKFYQTAVCGKIIMHPLGVPVINGFPQALHFLKRCGLKKYNSQIPNFTSANVVYIGLAVQRDLQLLSCECNYRFGSQI